MSNQLAAAWKLYELRHYDAAIAAVQQHLAHSPDDPEAYRIMAHAAGERGDASTALTAASRAFLLAPEDANVCLTFAVANHAADKMDVAEQAIREALRLNPQDARFHAELASQLMQTDRLWEAGEVVSDGLSLEPQHEYLLHARAAISWWQGIPESHWNRSRKRWRLHRKARCSMHCEERSCCTPAAKRTPYPA